MRSGTVRPRMFTRLYVLEQPNGTADDGGHIDLTLDGNWESLGEHWLKLHNQNSREFYRATQVQSETTHVADVPYSKVAATINTSMRWNDGTKKLQVLSAYDVDDAHEVIRMHLVQRT